MSESGLYVIYARARGEMAQVSLNILQRILVVKHLRAANRGQLTPQVAQEELQHDHEGERAGR